MMNPDTDVADAISTQDAATPPGVSAIGPSALEQMTRPLLELVQVITGLETTFITHIDWRAQTQEVLHALNTDELVVTEGSVVDWTDSMCRRTFLNGQGPTYSVTGDLADSLPSAPLGMRTFMAVPIIAGERTIGSVCGASRTVIDLDARSLRIIGLVASSLAAQLEIERDGRAHRERADVAEALALTDALTGLANRRAFTSRWEEELAGSGRHGHPIALLMVDVDDFKAVNDTHGHETGDHILRAVANAMTCASRAEDIVARVGGDEFALVTTRTDSSGAMEVADRLRSVFAQNCRRLGVHCTLSVGVSSSNSVPRQDLLAEGDNALYRAKAAGRNRVA